MRLIATFIENPVKVAVGVLLLVLFGAITVFRMPIELAPQVEQPWLTVFTVWPGAGPEEIEREIVYEQEKQLKTVPGMRYITSESANSMARVSMGFAADTDMNEALVKVNALLQQVSQYPETAREPTIYSGTDTSSTIGVFNLIPRPPNDEQLVAFGRKHPELESALDSIRSASVPTLVLERIETLAEEFPILRELLPDVDILTFTRFAEDRVAAAMARVPGVARVWLWGGKRDEMRVIVDPVKLASRGLTIADIRRVLRQQNHDTPAGGLDDGKRRFDVRTLGRYTSPQQIADEVVAMAEGAPIYVGDVAEVQLGHRTELDSAAMHFATTSLRLGVVKEPGHNLLEVMQGVRQVRDELNEGLLKSSQLLLYQSFDDTVYVNSAIGLVRKNILLGGLFTVAVLLLFLRSVRLTLIVAVTIPVSIIGTFLVLGLLGRSLNVVSLAGMSFAVGMLVDNAVVVLENIFRHHQHGASPTEAAKRGTAEVWGATLASTLTTLAVFVPILFVREEAGQLFRDIALAISCGVGLSLLVSVAVIPTAASRILNRAGGANKASMLARPAASMQHDRFATDVSAEDADGGPFLAVAPVSNADDPSRTETSRKSWFYPLDWLAGRFVVAVVSLNKTLQRSYALGALAVAVFVGGSVLLAFALAPSAEYLPSGSRNRVTGRITPPPGYNVRQMLQVGRQFYDKLRPYVDSTGSDSSATELSGPAIAEFSYGVWNGDGWVSAQARDAKRAGELVSLMKGFASEIPGVEASITQSGIFADRWGVSNRSIEIHVIGPDLDRLVQLGKQVRSQVHEMFPGVDTRPLPSLDVSKPEVHVIPRKLRAAEVGLTTSDLGLIVDSFVDAAYVTEYILDGEEIDLTIVSCDSDQYSVQELGTIPISTPLGQVVPLSAVADIRMSTGLERIRHIERQRAITILVTPPDDIPLADAIEQIEDQIVAPIKNDDTLRGSYRLSLSGTADALRDTWDAVRTNFVIAILITYLLMAALFESWLYPLVIMISLPLATVGGILGLRVVGLFTLQHLDILAMLGFIILIGTVVNNAILIVHQSLNYMRHGGLSPDVAILRSVQTRIRPIFMTTVTTTFGLLPLVVRPGPGSELYRGLGAVVLGGLLISTVFTLFLVPTLFSLALRTKSAVLERFCSVSRTGVTTRAFGRKAS